MSGYIDLQVNGYGGVDFNADSLDGDALHATCQRLRADGVARILATIITDALPVMERRLRSIAALRGADPLTAEVITGIHIEGPFLNETPGYIGAHPAEQARPADADAMQRLLDAAGGLTRIVTLAPERDPDLRVTRMLADAGVVVSAGHCDPTLEQLDAAIEAGLSMVTHLGNGCPPLLPRHDNFIQRVLARSSHLRVGLIADGYHLPPFVLSNLLQALGDSAFIVSDAMAAAGLGPGSYELAGQPVVVGDELVPWSADRSHFVGSACPIRRMADVLRGIEVPDAEIHQLTVDRPAAILDETNT